MHNLRIALCWLAWGVFLAVSVSATAATRLVSADGSGPYPDLNSAVTAAASGDTIMLGDGVFTGPGNRNLMLDDFSLTFLSQSGDPAQCAVDLEGIAGEIRRFFTVNGSTGTTITL